VGDDFETCNFAVYTPYWRVSLSMPFMWVMILKLHPSLNLDESSFGTFNALYVGDDFET